MENTSTNMEKENKTGARIMSWGAFIVIVGLIVWGLIAANNKASKIEGNIRLPSEITADDWSTGSSTAATTLVEYGDFQCPACGAYYPFLKQLITEHGNEFRFIHRHFPLPQHQNAYPAGIAAEAAGKQGKFWQMHDMLFETQDAWSDSSDPNTIFTGYAKTLGLDVDQFTKDIADTDHVLQNKITADLTGGQRAGINSTPTFFLNGKKITNPGNYEEFVKLIQGTQNASTTTSTGIPFGSTPAINTK